MHDADYCKSEVFRILNDQPIKMAVADDNNKDVSYLTGYKTEDDRFYILSGCMGETLMAQRLGCTVRIIGQLYVSGLLTTT